MADINPDPHEYGYTFIPLNRITALFSSSDDARAAVKELHTLGFGPKTLDVFVGEQGAEALDLSGEGHGTVTEYSGTSRRSWFKWRATHTRR